MTAIIFIFEQKILKQNSKLKNFILLLYPITSKKTLFLLKNKFESDLQNKISLIKNVFVNSQENSSLFSTHEYLSFDLIWF